MSQTAGAAGRRRIGVLVGLAEEAALVRRATRTWPNRPLVVFGGGTTEAARLRLPELLAHSPELLLSVGYSGGLMPGLTAGTLVVPETVVDAAGRRWNCDATAAGQLREAARRLGLPLEEGAMLGADTPAATADVKRSLHRATAAAAVDLESHLLAEAATEAGLAFAVVRSVLDDAGTELPPPVLQAVDPDSGRPQLGYLLGAVVRRPQTLPALLRLGRANAAAKASLRRLLARPLPL